MTDDEKFEIAADEWAAYRLANPDEKREPDRARSGTNAETRLYELKAADGLVISLTAYDRWVLPSEERAKGGSE
jgi:hypothetical protein